MEDIFKIRIFNYSKEDRFFQCPLKRRRILSVSFEKKEDPFGFLNMMKDPFRILIHN
jgi:hypothetical protein